jgi:poly(A) polymerase
MCGQNLLSQDLSQKIFREVLGLCDESYMVGGAVRDLLLGSHAVTDLDFAVEGDGYEIARSLASSLGANSSFVPLDKERRTGRVVIRQEHQNVVDISTIRGSGITDDLFSRDFTVNAMAVHLWDAINGRLRPGLVDPLNGRQDLGDRIIRVCTGGSFPDDPIRMLRAFRFALCLDFRISEETRSGIEQHSNRVKLVSGERIRDELAIILSHGEASNAIREMAGLSLITAIFPELEATRGLEQNAFHHLDVWGHTVETIANLERTVEQLSVIFGSLSDRIKDYIFDEPVSGRPRIWLMKLALLFHDSGKPGSLTVTPDGRRRFIGHEKLSKTFCLDAGTRIKLASRELSEVSNWVESHMRSSILTNETLSQRAVVRLHQRFGLDLIGLVLIYLSDLYAAKGPARKSVDFERAKIRAYQAIELAFKHESSPTKPLLDGFAIMDEFGLEQGPLLGSIIRWLVTEQTLGSVKDRSEAVEAVRRYLAHRPTKLNSGTEAGD